MCLVTFQKHPKETEIPVKSYKIMNGRRINEGIKLTSYFKDYYYHLNEIHSLNISDLLKFKEPLEYPFNFYKPILPEKLKKLTNIQEDFKSVYEVNYGFHSYDNLEYTEALAAEYNYYRNNDSKCAFAGIDLIITECEIPSGSNVYEGVDNSYENFLYPNTNFLDKSTCYCSDKIKILRWKTLYDSEWHEFTETF